MPRSWSEIKAGVDPEEAVLLITRLRHILEEAREDATVQHTAARLRVQNIVPYPLNEAETKIVVRALQKVAYRGRSRGSCDGRG